MRLISYNLRKHRAASELASLVAEHDPDILCLQECDSAALRDAIGGLSLVQATSGNRLGLAMYVRRGSRSRRRCRAWQTTLPRSETLASQRAAVEPIRQWAQQTGTPWLAARSWGATIAPIVMSGAHVGLWDADAMAGVPQLTGTPCDTETLVEGSRYRVWVVPR